MKITYTYKGKVCVAKKDWTLAYAVKVLERLGATSWEIEDKERQKNLIEQMMEADEADGLYD